MLWLILLAVLVLALVLAQGYGNFQPGHLVPCTWQGKGLPLWQLNIKEQSLDISVLLHDVTGVKAQGRRARIAGPTDLAGRFMLDLDLDEPWYASPPLLIPGMGGIAKFGTGTVNGIQCPMIVEKLHHAGAVEKELTWDVDMKCSSLQGFIVYPPLGGN